MFTRRLAFRVAAVVAGGAVALALLAALDVYAHARLAKYAALNVWGYRGPVAARKKPGEWRLVVAGGSTVLGLGLPWDQAFPALLERGLRRSDPAVSVINLGFDGENARAFAAVLSDYAYLDYDAAILYEGYNNLVPNAPGPLRERSLVFRLTGYYPVLPTAIREKVLLWRYHGDLAAAYRDQPVFRGERPGGADADAVADAVRRHIGPHGGQARASSPHEWDIYLAGVDEAVRYARAHGKPVLVVTQPYISDRHEAQQAALRAWLGEWTAKDPCVQYADLGSTVDLTNRALAYDGMHLTLAGNDIVASALADPVVRLRRASCAPR